MGRKELVVKKLKAFRSNLNKDFPVKKIFLFGSFASGKVHRDSDIDLIIVSPGFSRMNFFKRGAKMYDYWNLEYPVDFLCYTPKEFNKLKKQATIVRDAVENGIEIN